MGCAPRLLVYVGADHCSVSALELVVNDWLHASLNACDVVSHGVHAGLGGVNLDDVLKLSLAAVQLILPESALGSAIFNHLFFRIFSLLQHLLNIAYSKIDWVSPLIPHFYIYKVRLPGVAICGESLGSY